MKGQSKPCPAFARLRNSHLPHWPHLPHGAILSLKLESCLMWNGNTGPPLLRLWKSAGLCHWWHVQTWQRQTDTKYVRYGEIYGLTISRGGIRNTLKYALKHSFKNHDIIVGCLGKRQQRAAWNATIWNLESFWAKAFSWPQVERRNTDSDSLHK